MLFSVFRRLFIIQKFPPGVWLAGCGFSLLTPEHRIKTPIHKIILLSHFCSALCLAYYHSSWCAAFCLPSILPSFLPPSFLPPYCPSGHLGKCSPKASAPQILSPFGALPYLPSLYPAPALWQHCLATQLGHRWWLPWWWRFSKQKGIWVFLLPSSPCFTQS